MSAVPPRLPLVDNSAVVSLPGKTYNALARHYNRGRSVKLRPVELAGKITEGDDQVELWPIGEGWAVRSIFLVVNGELLEVETLDRPAALSDGEAPTA